jgi:hypothetical protein
MAFQARMEYAPPGPSIIRNILTRGQGHFRKGRPFAYSTPALNCGAISHKRRHKRTDVIVLFPTSLRLFAVQMESS